ncbi:MAG: hypothetical protein U9Q69_01340 [Nanoarchaeota archaeon]|nr:hypothetical protein [Nanoarchaeota archaeon]
MLEGGDSATDELKRVDHLIFVTLKYTRTVDIIRNVLKRLKSALEFGTLEVLYWAEENKKIEEVPKAPLMRIKFLRDIFPKDPLVKEITIFYMDLRTMLLSEFKKKEEYRKNVALITDGKEITIVKLKELAEKTKNYIYYLKDLIK